MKNSLVRSIGVAVSAVVFWLSSVSTASAAAGVVQLPSGSPAPLFKGFVAGSGGQKVYSVPSVSIPAGNNRLLVVMANHPTWSQVSTVTVNFGSGPITMTPALNLGTGGAVHYQYDGNYAVGSVWYLVETGNFTGTPNATVTATFAGVDSSSGTDADMYVGVFGNVSQTTPVTNVLTDFNSSGNLGTGGTTTLAIPTGNTTDMSFDCLDSAGTSGDAASGSQSQIFQTSENQSYPGVGVVGLETLSGSIRTGGGSMAYTSDAYSYIHIGMLIKFAAVATPTVTASPGSLNLGTTNQGTAGTAQSITVSGSNLTANLIVTAPTGVEVSIASGSGYGPTVNLTPAAGTVATTTIYARIASTASAGSVSGNITVASTGATTQTVSVSGTVNASPTVTASTSSLAFGTTNFGTASSNQTFTVGGTSLTANLTVTAPTGVEVSTSSGSGFGSSVSLTPAAGTVATTTIYARISAAAAGGTISGNIACASTGATTQNISVTGAVAPVASASPTSQTVGNNNNTTAVIFTSNVTGTTYTWMNNNTMIGIGASGSGSQISSFTATNTGTSPIVGTFTVTPTANGVAGATFQFTITVNPTPIMMVSPTAQTVGNNANTSTVIFTSNVTGTTYVWTNDNANIGIGLSGSGSAIASFTATNTGTSPIVGNFKVTPTAGGVVGPYQTFTITVNPTPIMMVSPTSQTVANNANTSTVIFTSNVTGTTYTWMNNNTTIGIGASGSGSAIASFTATNTGATPVTATFKVTPTAGGVVGPYQTFTITVNPTVTTPAPLATSAATPPPGTPAGAAFDSIRSGAAISSTGALAYRGWLSINGTTTPPITSSNNQGIWKSPDTTGVGTTLISQTSGTAPGTGGSVFDMLPINPVINNSSPAQVTFRGTLRVGSNANGLWTEMGGNGLQLLLQDGESLGGSDTVAITCPTTWVSTGNSTAACSVTLTNGKSAMVRLAVANNAGTTVVTPTVIAHSGDATTAFGAADTFSGFNGNSTDPRVDAAGDMAFNAFTPASGSNKQAVLFVAAGGSTIVPLAVSGTAAPGIMGDNFKTFERPTLGNGHTVAFRAFTTNYQAVYKGDPTTPSSIQPVAVSLYTSAQISTIPANRQLWSIWGPFSNVNGHIAFEASLTDTGTSNNESQAIFSDVSGTLKLIANAGDPAPNSGVGGDTFASFGMPVIGDGDKVAFTATTTGGVTGLWQYTVAGGVTEVMKITDSVTISGTPEIIANIAIPGGTNKDRANETRCIDSAGHILTWVMYQSVQTGVLVSPP